MPLFTGLTSCEGPKLLETRSRFNNPTAPPPPHPSLQTKQKKKNHNNKKTEKK